MKTIRLADGKQVAKFNEADLEVFDDRYQVLGTVFPLSALGKHAIVDYVEASCDLTEMKSATLKVIDGDVDDIYANVIGNRGTEYAEAEREALDFKAANYAGQVPPTVQSWASVKNWTPQVAADDIITQATAWRNAALSIRANRLKEKETVRIGTTIDEVSAAQARWVKFRDAIRISLGISK